MNERRVDEARSTIAALFRETGVLESGRYNIDRLWQTPEPLERFVGAFVTWLEEIDQQNGFERLVLVDSVGPLVGALPIGGMLSVQLKKPLMVWKEPAALIAVDPHVSGSSTDEPVSVAVLYCVTRYGTTAAHVLETLYEKDYLTTAFVALVDLGEGAKEIIEEVGSHKGIDIRFHYLLRGDQIVV